MTEKKLLNDMILAAGEIAMNYRKTLADIQVESKESVKDIVTEADQSIERYLREQIAIYYPDHAITGEEEGVTGDSDYRWIIDPIDGTVSFLHGQHFFSISIALAYKEELILGAVYAPALNELFWAEKGKGATLNGKPISVSSESVLERSVVSTGFACLRSNITPNNLPLFGEIATKVRGVRRFGSAAMDLCLVACGRIEAYWEKYINIYDVAAGMLIVQEAGGRVSDYSDCVDALPGEILASNGQIHSELVTIMAPFVEGK